MPPISPTPDGIRLTIQVQPRAAATDLAGLHGDALKIRVSAPPVDGAANEALVRFLADVLGVPRSAVTIAHGLSGRRKIVSVTGVGVAEAARRLQVGGG